MRRFVISIPPFIVSFLFFFPTLALGGVIVHDMVVVEGDAIMLKVETRGKLFRKGGEVVEFFVDGKSIGRSLSGGDGIAFKRFTPFKSGTYRISAKSGTDEGKGLLLALRSGVRVVFVDVEGSLLERFSNKPKQASQKVLKRIKRSFPVVLLQTGLLDKNAIKKWMKENEFVELPVLAWGQGALFDEMAEKGFKVKAVIGSRGVIESAKEYKPRAFSFEDVEGAEVVKDWEEIGKKLK